MNDQAPTLPQPFGRYVLTRLIGEGGMAEVYLASVQVAEGLTKRVVIKKIRKDYADHQEFTRMFVDEAKIALSLNHANIVQVFDFGQVQGAFYLAMEQVEGVDVMRLFHAVAQADESIPPIVAAYLGHQVAAALAYAHRKRDDHGHPLGLVHRDISPHNVMVSFEGQVKILDFGIARTAGGGHANASRRAGSEGPGNSGDSNPSEGRGEETIKGKVAYMSPEQAHGRPLDHRSDVYSLGVVLHELLSGRLVFRSRDRLAALERVRTEPLPSLSQIAPEVPAPLVAIVDRALQRDADDRYETARAMQSDLAKFLHSADPVIDDEGVSAFVAKYVTPTPPPLTAEVARAATASRAGQTSYPARRGSVSRVVVIHVALEARPLPPAHAPVDVDAFLKLVQDIAFKRDAHVLRSDAQGVVLAFGVILQAPDDADRALRTALALQDDVGQMAPGLRVGMVVARVRASVKQAENAAHVSIGGGLRDLLHKIAAASMEGPVMVAGSLLETLGRAWRFGPDALVDPEPAKTHSAVDGELETIAPVLGPALAHTRSRAAAPGGRALLFGRELELKALRDTFSAAIRSRQSRAVLVLGEPGVGKRALVERFVASLPRTACWVLRASGSYARRNVSLGVFLDLFTRFLGVEHTTTSADLIRSLQSHGVREADVLGAALGSALGLEGEDDSALDPFTRRDRLWKLVRRLTTALAQRRPVLILIENIHLHDEQSIQLLREWAQQRHSWPILGITTGRPGNPRVEAIRAEDNVAKIVLQELDPRARRELITSRFEDTEPARELAESIVAQTGGNPLFIEQSLAALLERGVIGWNAQGRALTVKQRGAPITVPPSVEAALVERIEQLPAHDRQALLGAAVLGRQFRTHELADLLERSVGKSVDLLIGRLLLERLNPSSPLAENARFATLSLHDACRRLLPEDERRRLHAQAATLLRARPDYAPERDDGPIADHLMQAGRASEAVAPALAAATRAFDIAGNVEAYYHLSQALGAIDASPEGATDPRRWEALLRRERILRAWGRRRAQGADVRALLDTATRAGDPEKQAIASIRLLRFYLEVGRTHQAERLLPRIDARIDALTAPAAFRAALGELRSELFFAQGDFDTAEAAARSALPFCASDARGQRQRCRLLRSIGQVKNSAGRYAQARQCYAEALDIAQAIGNQRLEANLLNALGEVAGRSTRYQAAVDHFKAALAIDRDLGDRYATGRKLANLGIAYACIGLARRAERFLRKALELHEAVGHPGEFNDAAVHLGEVVARNGDPNAAKAVLLDAAGVAASRGDIRTELRARVRLAQVLLSGERTNADETTAAQTAEQVLSTARAQGLRTATARALHVLARIAIGQGREADAVAHLREGVELIQAGAAPVDGVRSIHLLGTLLEARGDDDDARALLAEAGMMVKSRLDELRDEDLRAGYLEQAEARQILRDGGFAEIADAAAKAD